ncbi:molybdopterin molybdotransferase MoeA [Geomonas sp. Red32]|uniref:molybdopterin molybdotransferase MoeA n=1 Tax=Geomonas sp. Red32 TaxID=2912856 RepID=UPI00202CC3F6|nr:gephyrin-like molybdotransferase Glp [Geomonas sp. Red32]MCM0083243.1 molybdopterin molybdotransferase MoeA [Geomonas sp. Red32]
MSTYEEARATILSKVAPIGVERVPLMDAVGRILAADFTAPWDIPAWDNSAMDGFAVRAEECAPGTTLKVTSFLPAGVTPGAPLENGCAARIMTGAPIPPGADSVVPHEETHSGEGVVTLLRGCVKGANVRVRGEDVAAGSNAITAGTVIGPPQVSLLASFSAAMVPVYRRPRVAIISTGDELVELGTQPAYGQIINSNILAVAAAVRLCGAEPLLLGIARDTMESHLDLLAEGLKADVLITSAGVSAGDRDLVRSALKKLGVVEEIWKVGVKPGGPMAFGTKEAVPVFSLPGNPVATMITFEEFVRPALLKMLGHGKPFRRRVKGFLSEPVRMKPGTLHFLRVAVTVENGRYLATTAGSQKSGTIKTMLRCNALALLPAERTDFTAGEEVDLHLLDNSLDMES